MNARGARKLLLIGAISTLVILFYCVFLETKRFQTAFSDEITRVATSEPDYFMICSIAPNSLAEDCDLAVRNSGDRLPELLSAMKAAKSHLVGKNSVAQEKMLRLGRGEPGAKEYLGCYRLIQFTAMAEIALNKVEAAPGCTHVIRYDPGSVILSNAGKWLLPPEIRGTSGPAIGNR
jgi:hypothetical protein